MMFRAERFVIHRPVSLGSVRYEQNCTLVASHQVPSTNALESFCELTCNKYLKYCLKEPLSNFEGVNIFWWLFITVNILYCIYYMGHSAIPTICTTVRIILITL